MVQTLPPLGDIPREARLNLAVYHLRNADLDEAARLLENLKPSTPPEYMLKVLFFPKKLFSEVYPGYNLSPR